MSRQLLHKVAFKTQFLAYFYLEQKCPSTAAIFNSSVVENNATSNCLQRHFVLKPTKQVMGQAAARRTAALIFLVSDSQFYPVNWPIRGLEGEKKWVFVAATGNCKRQIKFNCEIEKISKSKSVTDYWKDSCKGSTHLFFLHFPICKEIKYLAIAHY